MAEPQLVISYDGGDANAHAIDARLYGQSLQGLDRMVSDCLIIVSEVRLPKRGDRATLTLKVKEAEAGSYTSPAFYQEISDALAIGVPIIQAIGPEIIAHYISAVLDKFQGKDSAVELAIQRMAEMHRVTVENLNQMHRDSLSALDRKDERQHQEHMGIQDLLRRAIDGSGPAARDYVAPVGKSVDTATFLAGGSFPVTVGKDGADAIRDSQKLDWEALTPMVLRTDGFRFHSNGLSVENPEKEDGYLMADVDDPTFSDEANPYTLAAQTRARIRVRARMGYKNGKLSKIQIVEFIEQLDEAA